MMYGFGDDRNPYTESVDILEDLVIEYITEMVRFVCIIEYVLYSLPGEYITAESFHTRSDSVYHYILM